MAYRHKQHKRIRKVSEIEAEIAIHKERYEKHLQWKDRNKLFAEQRKLYCEGIIKRISQVRNSKSSYKKLFGVINSRKLTDDAKDRLTKLEQELATSERRALWDVPMLDFQYEPYPNSRNMSSDWKMIPYYLYKELTQAKKREQKKEKQRNLRARVAQAENKSREAASEVKSRLKRNHMCPYCGGKLGETPHADHIYPISRGGFSTLINMVYVCSDCNKKKGGKTLRMFIDDFGLDRNLIEKRLSALCKEF